VSAGRGGSSAHAKLRRSWPYCYVQSSFRISVCSTLLQKRIGLPLRSLTSLQTEGFHSTLNHPVRRHSGTKGCRSAPGLAPPSSDT
jgi:hypothetical protein